MTKQATTCQNSRSELESPMLTFEEALKYLKVSQSFLYKATASRTIPFYKPTGGKLIRFPKEDLDHWLLQNRFDSRNEIAEQFSKGG